MHAGRTVLAEKILWQYVAIINHSQIATETGAVVTHIVFILYIGTKICWILCRYLGEKLLCSGLLHFFLSCLSGFAPPYPCYLCGASHFLPWLYRIHSTVILHSQHGQYGYSNTGIALFDGLL